jgi:hypothetical protein
MSNGRWQWLSGAHRSTAHSAPPTAVRGTTGTGPEQAIPEFEFSGGEECRGMRVLVTATATGARARSSRAAAKGLALARGGAAGGWLLGAGGWGWVVRMRVRQHFAYLDTFQQTNDHHRPHTHVSEKTSSTSCCLRYHARVAFACMPCRQIPRRCTSSSPFHTRGVGTDRRSQLRWTGKSWGKSPYLTACFPVELP